MMEGMLSSFFVGLVLLIIDKNWDKNLQNRNSDSAVTYGKESHNSLNITNSFNGNIENSEIKVNQTTNHFHGMYESSPRRGRSEISGQELLVRISLILFVLAVYCWGIVYLTKYFYFDILYPIFLGTLILIHKQIYSKIIKSPRISSTTAFKILTGLTMIYLFVLSINLFVPKDYNDVVVGIYERVQGFEDLNIFAIITNNVSCFIWIIKCIGRVFPFFVLMGEFYNLIKYRRTSIFDEGLNKTIGIYLMLGLFFLFFPLLFRIS